MTWAIYVCPRCDGVMQFAQGRGVWEHVPWDDQPGPDGDGYCAQPREQEPQLVEVVRV